MKIYKTIFRLDYPLNYSLIDKLGSHAEAISQEGKKMGLEQKLALNLPGHIVTSSGHQGEDYFMITVTPQTVVGVIEHYSGCDLNSLHNHSVLKIGDSIVKGISGEGETTFLRYGVRVWSITNGVAFDSVLKHFGVKNNPQSDALNSSGLKLTDIGIVLESVSAENAHNARIQFGPYKQEENPRYFSLKESKDPVTIGIKEGLIIDADVWQSNNKINQFELTKYSKFYVRELEQLIEKIIKNTISEVKE